MDTKKLWSILLVLLISLPTWSADIVGKVLDAATRQPLDFVNVSLTKPGEETPINGVVTDAEGVFALPNIKDGKYMVTVSFMGYITQHKPVDVKGQSVDLGKIFLKEDTQNLQEVEVVGQGSGSGRTRQFDAL